MNSSLSEASRAGHNNLDSRFYRPMKLLKQFPSLRLSVLCDEVARFCKCVRCCKYHSRLGQKGCKDIEIVRSEGA